MSISSILSISASAIAAVLGVVMLVQGGSSLSLQTELQKRTQEIQTQQQEISLQQQELQARQQRVNTATQLAQQLGPQVISSLKVVGMRSNNAKVFALLTKYGVQITDQEKEQIKKLLEEEKAKGEAPK
jgi:cell division protein FtsL